jgi:hypothetical protein
MPSVSNVNVYQRAAAALADTANSLNRATKDALKESKGAVKDAGFHATESLSHAAGSVSNVVMAGAHAIDGTISVAEAGGRAAAATAIGAVGTAGWVAEEGLSGVRFAFANLAKFFSALYNGLGAHLGKTDRASLETEILGDPTAQRFSERMFEQAGNQLRLSGAAAEYAWDSYAEALGHAAGSVVNAGYAAIHAGATLGNLGAAALYAGEAGAAKVAELGVRAARVGVIYAEKGVEAARDATLLAAEASATVANALARPDQAQYKISLKDIKALEAQVIKLEQAAQAA